MAVFIILINSRTIVTLIDTFKDQNECLPVEISYSHGRVISSENYRS